MTKTATKTPITQKDAAYMLLRFGNEYIQETEKSAASYLKMTLVEGQLDAGRAGRIELNGGGILTYEGGKFYLTGAEVASKPVRAVTDEERQRVRCWQIAATMAAKAIEQQAEAFANEQHDYAQDEAQAIIDNLRTQARSIRTNAAQVKERTTL